MFKIEKDVPIPARCRGRSKYPWDRMAVGDSFIYTLADAEDLQSTQSKIGNNARHYGRRNQPGFKVSVRRVSETEIRVWRVA